MKLQRAEIQNFRSIASVELPFLQGCQVLIGINESGKSNILRALQLLDPTVVVAPSDLRIERRDESPVVAGFVRFDFELDEAEIEDIYLTICKGFDASSLNEPLISNGTKTLTLKEFCRLRCIGLQEVSLANGTRRATYWALPSKKYQMVDGWKASKHAEDFVIVSPGNATVSVKNAQIFQSNLFKTIDGMTTEPVTPDKINDLIGALVSKQIKAELPQCVYWKYSDQYLLPSSLNIDEFVANPDICIPLKSMFELAGFTGAQIGTTITATRQQQPHRYLNLLTRVSNAATNHLHSVWQDHKGVKIDLRANGAALIPVIQDDQVPLDMANRSDGFKRFVSFLLQVSAKVKTAQLKNTLILIDEPEIALHPRGAKSLMHELISIGKSNSVVYSTHSIFMIDRENIDRHIIVEKKNEVTTTWRAEKSRVQDEDVLYGAIGYSIFETVNKQNLVFEGWRDKELFRVVRDAKLKEDKSLKPILDGIGLTFAEGIKDVKHVTKFLELANRGCLIISDGDGAGISGQKEHSRSGGWGKWVTLNDIYGPGQKISIEDLLTQTSLIKRSNQFRKQFPRLQEMTAANFKPGESAVKTLDAWIKTLTLENDEHKEALHQLKNHLFEKLKRDDLIDEAEQLVEFVLKHDFTME
jgi:energy-coupling factor transporter ATP-binding protein EcfA2